MNTLDRRNFIQLLAGTLFSAASVRLLANTEPPALVDANSFITVKGLNYSWEYNKADDTFRLKDSHQRLIVSGKLQPAIVVAPRDEPSRRVCTPGKAVVQRIDAGRVVVEYAGINGTARATVAWRFDAAGIWMEPIQYETDDAQDVVSLHYFSESKGTEPIPSLHASYFVVPGISSGSAISPIVREYVNLNENVWLGRGSSNRGLNQQWGLPVHYFSGFSTDRSTGTRQSYTAGHSAAFTCGLVDLPNGDLFLNLHEGNSAMWIDYRSDLWQHVRGPGRLALGANFLWTVGSDYYEATAFYYAGLVKAGIIHPHENSAAKTAVALTPQFCTWGAQLARDKANERMDEAFLNSLYEEFKASGMKAGMFSIDDKWEGSYGNLEHSSERLPNFEKFLARIRSDGYRVGIWAALMRCESPSALGLTVNHMLKRPDGTPYKVSSPWNPQGYYIIDFTQPDAAAVLADLARKFVRRYQPDLVKFDFGYELPAMGIAAPKDRSWSGERLLAKGLTIVISAMREVKPDLVVMYYQLSPLFLDYFDLHGLDDLFNATGEYDLEANRRFFFSSLLGPLGIPTYGSTGYDWSSAPNIWFDSAAMGTLGSLNDFVADEQGQRAEPRYIAKFNGLSRVRRATSTFRILPLDTNPDAPTMGARSRSWARLEKEQLVLLAYRPPLPGNPDILKSAAIDVRVRDAIRSPVAVVVASLTTQDLGTTPTLGVVPDGDGEIMIRRQQGSQANISHHYFGGKVQRSQISIGAGWLKLPVTTASPPDAPLEWIEIEVS